MIFIFIINLGFGKFPLFSCLYALDLLLIIYIPQELYKVVYDNWSLKLNTRGRFEKEKIMNNDDTKGKKQ